MVTSENADLTPGVTVVICTYERPSSVRRVLDSILMQERQPDATLIIDASTDRRTEEAVRAWNRAAAGRTVASYQRVSRDDRGLTRQRNVALDCVATDLVAFFDDDVVLEPNCLKEMEHTHRRFHEVVGVGCFGGPQVVAPSALWRLRRCLRIVPSLAPGRYHRSGMSTPWEFDSRCQPIVEGDWLPGWGMMWKTSLARRVRFHDGFAGYSQGEDLDFSLRLRREGKLWMVRSAGLRHLPDPAGRPNPFRLGYMEIYNRYHIHRRGLPDRSLADVAWFVYAWTVDTVLLCRHLIQPSRSLAALRQVAGRLHAAHHLLRQL